MISLSVLTCFRCCRKWSVRQESETKTHELLGTASCSSPKSTNPAPTQTLFRSMVVSPPPLLGDKRDVDDSNNHQWLLSKCLERPLRFDRSRVNRSSRSNWYEEEPMDTSSIAKCFLVPMWWGPSGLMSRFSHHDRLHKHLVLSHGVNGPSARIVLWKNYLGFDEKGVRRNLGVQIRAHNARGQLSEADDIENANQSFLGSMLGTAVSTYVNSQLEYCGELEVHVGGSNRDILRGQLNKVKISAKDVVYKGVALSDLDLSASSIRVKLGKNRLLQDPLHVKLLVSICEKDLKASLSSPFLAGHLKDILPAEFSKADSLVGVKVSMQDGVVLLTNRQEAKLGYKSASKSSSVALTFEIMNGGKTVYINSAGDHEQADNGTSGKCFNVGAETSIQSLGVIGSRLVVGGQFYVTP